MLKELLCGMWVAMSLVGFAAMAVDKARAKRGAWRISEARLMAVAALLGAPGSLLGMLTFRHKIRHPKFRFGGAAVVGGADCAVLLDWRGVSLKPKRDAFVDGGGALWGDLVGHVVNPAFFPMLRCRAPLPSILTWRATPTGGVARGTPMVAGGVFLVLYGILSAVGSRPALWNVLSAGGRRAVGRFISSPSSCSRGSSVS